MLRTTATLSADGTHYVVNGVKKWITNGHFAHYFSTAVRTGGEGVGGVSLLLVERGEGLETDKIKVMYGSSGGTAYVTFDNVKVPVGNLLGKQNEGFKAIMANFNHERWCVPRARHPTRTRRGPETHARAAPGSSPLVPPQADHLRRGARLAERGGGVLQVGGAARGLRGAPRRQARHSRQAGAHVRAGAPAAADCCQLLPAALTV